MFGIEGTGSYGAGPTSAVRRRGLGAVEVLRTDRRDRRLRGKSDTIDAGNAARAVLNDTATAVPETNDGTVEMIRQVKVAKDVAVKARTSAMITLEAVIVTADPELREQLRPLTKMALIHRCAGLRPGTVDTVTAATEHTLRAIARRWQHLDDEIKSHETLQGELTEQLVPQPVDAFGIGADTAYEMLIVAGDNIDRVRSEPAWARLCDVAPIPASSGTTNRHRLNRGGHRQANAALYRAVIVRMRFHQPTIAYVTRRTAEGKTTAEIIRCLKRLPAREIRALPRPLRSQPTSTAQAA
ncbi:transposase [Actinosynnema sp. CS-041913]|uniref:transposase n=1 Tax=Actinosynnema sp. CS-041913 TaxID=3239917 RepID=UPI003D921405